MDLYQQARRYRSSCNCSATKALSTTSAFCAFRDLDMMRKAVDAANPGPDPSKETWLMSNDSDNYITLK